MLVDKVHFPTRHEIKAGTRKNPESRSHDMTKHQTSNIKHLYAINDECKLDFNLANIAKALNPHLQIK